MLQGDVDDWRDVMRMFVDYRRFRSAHPDLARFHRRRYDVYCDLLGFDLEAAPVKMVRHRRVHGLLVRFADAFPLLHSPFANYLEAPAYLAEVHRPHISSMATHFAALENLYLDVMVDCAVRLWGPCQHRVTAEELSERGVGREQEPDEFLYV